jgi:hypothetical protein
VAGLNLRGGAGISLSSVTVAPSDAQATLTVAAFGPGATMQSTSAGGHPLNPKQPVGMAFWGGVVAIVLLVCIRRSLPN